MEYNRQIADVLTLPHEDIHNATKVMNLGPWKVRDLRDDVTVDDVIDITITKETVGHCYSSFDTFSQFDVNFSDLYFLFSYRGAVSWRLEHMLFTCTSCHIRN